MPLSKNQRILQQITQQAADLERAQQAGFNTSGWPSPGSRHNPVYAQDILLTFIRSEGWSDATALGVVLDYIDSLGEDNLTFGKYLQDRAAQWNGEEES